MVIIYWSLLEKQKWDLNGFREWKTPKRDIFCFISAIGGRPISVGVSYGRVLNGCAYHVI